MSKCGLTTRTIGRFLAALDTVASDDTTRASIQTIHVMRETPGEPGLTDEHGVTTPAVDGMTRLAATNGHVAAICDIPTYLLTYACEAKPPLAYCIKGENGERCYVTPKKANLEPAAAFPYPNLILAISGQQIMRPDIHKYFAAEVSVAFCKLYDLYCGNKAGTTGSFVPTHANPKASRGAISADYGFLFFAMPVLTRFSSETIRDRHGPIFPIRDYLDGLDIDAPESEAAKSNETVILAGIKTYINNRLASDDPPPVDVRREFEALRELSGV